MSANIKYLKLGPKASSFYDMSTGLHIVEGEVIAVNEAYLSKGRRTARALQGGHIAYATAEEYNLYHGNESVDMSKDKTPNALSEKFFNLYNNKKSVKEISDAFNKAELVSIAELAEIEVEDSDTKASIIEALIEDIEENKE